MPGAKHRCHAGDLPPLLLRYRAVVESLRGSRVSKRSPIQSRILFGSDFPYGPGGAAEQFTAMLDAKPAAPRPRASAAIDRGNATALFSNNRAAKPLRT